MRGAINRWRLGAITRLRLESRERRFELKPVIDFGHRERYSNGRQFDHPVQSSDFSRPQIKVAVRTAAGFVLALLPALPREERIEGQRWQIWGGYNLAPDPRYCSMIRAGMGSRSPCRRAIAFEQQGNSGRIGYFSPSGRWRHRKQDFNTDCAEKKL
jgi:hypothetical protein